MERTRIRRKPQRGSHDRSVIDAILDEALVCHVALPGPVVLPTTFVRMDDHIYIHGAATNGMLSRLSEGLDVCVAVTLLDALVLAKTALHHSVNYRSVVIFGRGELVTDPARKQASLGALLDKVVPNRSRDCRMANDKELAATQIIAVSLAEASAKMRQGPPLEEDGADAALPYWAGVIPLITTRGEPISASTSKNV
jgi:nitroimidazol reductase NimA-like FMN-containing flavoprotein (pyridoxamine 5'-phosphate oxidase superfamily)